MQSGSPGGVSNERPFSPSRDQFPNIHRLLNLAANPNLNSPIPIPTLSLPSQAIAVSLPYAFCFGWVLGRVCAVSFDIVELISYGSLT